MYNLHDPTCPKIVNISHLSCAISHRLTALARVSVHLDAGQETSGFVDARWSPTCATCRPSGWRLPMYTTRLVGCSKSHRDILNKLTSVAPTDAEVLLVGPSGVGKELYANHVHVHSHRSSCRFVPVNCASLSGDLLENTLFGHIGGAFTGATALSEGLVSEAEGGTLFLDEVDSLSVPCQIKLLGFLQDQKYRRLGENRLRQANVRVIAATNSDLESAVQEARFRKDLFFRLRVVPVEIPALSPARRHPGADQSVHAEERCGIQVALRAVQRCRDRVHGGLRVARKHSRAGELRRISDLPTAAAPDRAVRSATPLSLASRCCRERGRESA